MFSALLCMTLAAPPTFNKDIKPLVEKRCMPCHTGQIQTLPNFTIYKTAHLNRFKIRKRVVELKNMPPGNSTQMTDEEREIIKKWIDGGAKE
jgi:uncharacterized membrane protein